MEVAIEHGAAIAERFLFFSGAAASQPFCQTPGMDRAVQEPQLLPRSAPSAWVLYKKDFLPDGPAD